MLTVHMSGLMYFHGCHAQQKVALLPNGTNPTQPYKPTAYVDEIAPHFASFWVEDDDIGNDCPWWRGYVFPHELEIKDRQGNVIDRLYVTEFQIPPLSVLGQTATVMFPDEWDEPARFNRFEDDLPKLQRIDQKFNIDLDTPDAIARVNIRGGNLDVFKFKRVASVKWAISHHLNPIKIMADQYYITLKPRHAEIVFSNNSDLLADDYPPGHDCKEVDPNNHFFLYTRLEKKPSVSYLKVPCYADHLADLVFKHSYFKKIENLERLVDSGCTPTCCG